MKKRFNIYCTLIFVAVVFSIVFPFFNGGGQAFNQGVHKSMSKNAEAVEEHKIDDPYFFTTVNIAPKNDPVYIDSLYNNTTGKYYKYIPARINLSDKNLAQETEVLDVCKVGMAIIAFLFLLVVLFRFIGMIDRVNNGQIFTGAIVNDLRIIGISLIVYCVCVFGFEWVGYYTLCSELNFKDFEIIAIFDDFNFELITGLSLLLLAEIFKMGIKMKEDQELTI